MSSTPAYDALNITNSTIGINHPLPSARSHWQYILFGCYVIGIVGNLAAIIALFFGERRIRNKKHSLLLKSLACNDFFAMVGMMAAMVASVKMPWLLSTRYYCGVMVVLRIFGVGSVCIAVVMALERCFALTRPFFYQKHITYKVIRRMLIGSWAWSAILTCLPFVGFGVYYNPTLSSPSKCERYRNATAPVDIAYAYLYLVFGAFLSICLIYCNWSVIRALCHIGPKRNDSNVIIRHVSTNSNKNRIKKQSSTKSNTANISTSDEINFSRLMAVLSVCFIICWIPNMVITLKVLLTPKSMKNFRQISTMADMLMLLNYALDPYLYVLLRGLYPIPKCLRNLFNNKILGKKSTDHESMKMTGTNDGVTAVLDLTPNENDEQENWKWPPRAGAMRTNGNSAGSTELIKK